MEHDNLSDYMPVTTEDIYSCFDYGYRNRSKVSFSVAKKAFDSWLAQHDAEVRASEQQLAGIRVARALQRPLWDIAPSAARGEQP